jgi:Ribbon-helix-helix protein, copG family
MRKTTDPAVVRSVSLPLSVFNRLAETKRVTGIPHSEVMRRALLMYYEKNQTREVENAVG